MKVRLDVRPHTLPDGLVLLDVMSLRLGEVEHRVGQVIATGELRPFGEDGPDLPEAGVALELGVRDAELVASFLIDATRRARGEPA